MGSASMESASASGTPVGYVDATPTGRAARLAPPQLAVHLVKSFSNRLLLRLVRYGIN